MPYSDETINVSTVKYVDRDFVGLKNSLINFSKQYFPNTYRDFNETSPGMMLIEMSAYVGDVLNFYIDNQFQEMMLPLAEERRNVINLARTFGYKNKAIVPAFVELKVTQELPADVSNPNSPVPNYTNALVLEKGMQIGSTSDNTIVFETLDVVDFQTSGSYDIEPEVSSVNTDTGLANKFKLTRKVKAISGETKTFTFNVGNPTKYLTLTLPDNDVVEIISCKDKNNNDWYEVDYLAQDRVPKELHWTSDTARDSAYSTPSGQTLATPVPYSLNYIKANKRFITQVDENGLTSLVFGNGILKNGQKIGDGFLSVEQIGLTLPGQTEGLDKNINPLLGDNYATLGEAPTQTSLTVEYRVGGGIKTNVVSGDLSSIVSATTNPAGLSTSTIEVTNDLPASGGADEESVEEIKQRVMNSYATQNRCVTKEDYEARILAMPAKFGGFAKVYVNRAGTYSKDEMLSVKKTNIINLVDSVINAYNTTINGGGDANSIDLSGVDFDLNADGSIDTTDIQNAMALIEEAGENLTERDTLPTIDVYTLSYDTNKNLIPTPTFIQQNLRKYLANFRLITDQVTLRNGFIINFGVVFDVVADRNANKQEIKVQCIQAIIDYFNIDKMNFKQTINSNNVEYILQGIPGVRSVNHVTLTQDFDWSKDAAGQTQPAFKIPLYDKVINSAGKVENLTSNGYGYYYKFKSFYGQEAVSGRGVVLPAYDPSVFELKNPFANVKGIVR
tara:strand:- start:22110 stop:24302 length:2193 start_codon:yes stop_codon:yes gene_type:complete